VGCLLPWEEGEEEKVVLTSLELWVTVGHEFCALRFWPEERLN